MDIVIIGGGPAGLRAAEVAAAAGANVTVFDAKPSVGRKLLVAGRGGLNLTKSEPPDQFASHYSGPGMPEGIWQSLLGNFDPEALRHWAAGLGVETFVASTGRVYPKQLKASHLLRKWIQRLRGMGAVFKMNHRWTGLDHSASGKFRVHFEEKGEPRVALADRLILALGGGSWPETGSDGKWTRILASMGVATNELVAANCGWEFPWPAAVLQVAEGKPIKNIHLKAGDFTSVGELMVTRYGLEGGALYQAGPHLRAHHELGIDFKPTFAPEQLATKLGMVRGDLLAQARQCWRLGEVVEAILRFCGPKCSSPEELANLVKDFRLKLTGPRPIAEAISSAGGICWTELDSNLMLKRWPGVFAAGEMIDWEAPTGGYLLQGCFAMGTRVGRAALELQLA